MIIYHSREALTARLAGLLHVGALGPQPDPARAWAVLQAPPVHGAEGLWPLGLDPDGHEIYAVGRASRPDVVDRVFHGVAEVFAIAPTTYLLVDVGPRQAWGDLLLVSLRRVGLDGIARGLEERLLARRWRACRAAVARARQRAAERSGPHPDRSP